MITGSEGWSGIREGSTSSPPATTRPSGCGTSSTNAAPRPWKLTLTSAPHWVRNPQILPTASDQCFFVSLSRFSASLHMLHDGPPRARAECGCVGTVSGTKRTIVCFHYPRHPLRIRCTLSSSRSTNMLLLPTNLLDAAAVFVHPVLFGVSCNNNISTLLIDGLLRLPSICALRYHRIRGQYTEGLGVPLSLAGIEREKKNDDYE